MKYSYYYATGAESVEIDEEWAALLQAMDREEDRKNAITYDEYLKMKEEGLLPECS